MSGKIESGQLCTVEPVDPQSLKVGDIVLCKVNGQEYLHLIRAIQSRDFRLETTAAGSTVGSPRSARHSAVACGSSIDAIATKDIPGDEPSGDRIARGGTRTLTPCGTGT